MILVFTLISSIENMECSELNRFSEEDTFINRVYESQAAVLPSSSILVTHETEILSLKICQYIVVFSLKFLFLD